MATSPAVERRHPPTALMKVMNPVTRQIVARGGAGGQLVLLHYRGRRSGRDFDTPVGYHRIGGQVYVLTNSPWRHNFEGGAPVEVTIRGHRRPPSPSSTRTRSGSPTWTRRSSTRSAGSRRSGGSD